MAKQNHQAVRRVNVVIVLHGSEDPDYLSDVDYFARRANVSYAFISHARPLVHEVHGDIYIPLFIGYGSDYDRAVSTTGYSSPPLLDWPRVREFLLGLGPGLYVLHGNDDPRFLKEVANLGLVNIAYLMVKPRLEEVLSRDCPGRVIPVLFANGTIYKRILEVTGTLCPNTYVEKPLFRLDSFINYFRSSLGWLINNTKHLRH
jgi:hypothetical protein